MNTKKDQEVLQLSGRCYCGSVTWSAQSKMLWAAICHCEDCRRAASADYVSWFGVKRDTVIWRGPRKCFSSSEKVIRSFCADCGSPTSFETQVFPDETHLYAATLDEPTLFNPSAHIFWSERLPWVKFSDGLPKHQKGLQEAALRGNTLLG